MLLPHPKQKEEGCHRFNASMEKSDGENKSGSERVGGVGVGGCGGVYLGQHL